MRKMATILGIGVIGLPVFLGSHPEEPVEEEIRLMCAAIRVKADVRGSGKLY